MAWTDKLDDVIKRAEMVNEKLSTGGLSSEELQKYSKEYGNLEPMVNKIKEYKNLVSNMENAKEMMNDSDPEMAEMAKDEFESAKEVFPEMEQELQIMMLPKDEADDKNVIMEIRAGAGGDEAGLFAGSLLRMYQRYAENRGWKTEILEFNQTDLDGYNFVSLSVSGENVYSRMKYESGGHRVQRVPETESSGRIHTSAATVAVLPEAEDIDIDINPADLRIDTYRASGAGGQHVNTTDSAVRITHVPTGVVSQCQSGRSQHKNKDQAMKMLKALIYDQQRQKAEEEMASDRKLQVGSGDRSQRIKTYNFPERRVTDHRIGLTVYKLDKIMDGELDEMLDAIITHDQLEQLANYGD
ncbi:MAG: peptide chain release factor 1 [Alphaproteobacteria bacterium]